MIVFAQSWGVPLIDFATDDRGKCPHCRDFMGEAFNEIKNNDSIKTVILFAEWANYTKGMRFGSRVKSHYTDSLSTEKSFSENSLAFSRSLERTRDFLSKAGKNVVIVTGVPEYEVSVSKALAKLRFMGNRDKEIRLPAVNEITLSKYQERNREVTKALGMLNVDERAFIIDAYKALCEKGYCNYISGNQVLYADGNHLTYDGSKIITRELQKYISE